MGYNTAVELAGLGISLEDSIRFHLTGNFFPSIPSWMVQPCIEAIDAYNNGKPNKLIKLKHAVYEGYKDKAPALAIIEQHHLEPWLNNNEEDYLYE